MMNRLASSSRQEGCWTTSKREREGKCRTDLKPDQRWRTEGEVKKTRLTKCTEEGPSSSELHPESQRGRWWFGIVPSDPPDEDTRPTVSDSYGFGSRVHLPPTAPCQTQQLPLTSPSTSLDPNGARPVSPPSCLTASPSLPFSSSSRSACTLSTS
jgi:hypothetical protein